MVALSFDIKSSIISLLENDKFTRVIASTLDLSHSTVSKFRSKHLLDLKRPRHGRSAKLTSADVRYTTRLILTDQTENAAQVTRVLDNLTNKPLTSQTIRNYLKKAGFKTVVKKKKPVLSTKHQHERLDFAIAHQY